MTGTSAKSGSQILPKRGEAPSRPSSGPLLAAQGLTLKRGHRIILHDIDLSVARGEAVVLLGANGAGKTTLLQCLAGLIRPQKGQVFWCGLPAGRDLLGHVGFLGHEGALYSALTARENLLFACRMYGLDHPQDRVEDFLSLVGLKKYKHDLVSRFSRGMKQRLALARAVIHDPSILLLDEPYANLDEAGRHWVHGFLRSCLARQRVIVLSGHDADQGRPLTDRLIRLQAGRLHAVECSTPEIADGEDTFPRRVLCG